ncbi:MAG: ATP-binding cassette domain-containing protein, partial [Deferrisomatales bacterium]|nr:ATP-binding cassette domain-containing protein [Deferrisomatales bacterium]
LREAESRLGAFPHELSGGMRQRVGLARLLATGAGCWLLDEPFSAVDERTRYRLQDLVLELRAARPLTVLLVTHGLDEAVYLGSRVHVMSAGPGRIANVLDIAGDKPHDRLDPEYGRQVEEVRRGIERELLWPCHS